MFDRARIFIGFDNRQPVSYNVLQFSILARARRPVELIPLVLHQLPVQRAGLTPFTYSRFLVPWLCDYTGWALFMDSDMLVQDDIYNLWELKDPDCALQVVKGAERFEWASLMLFNCEKNKALTPLHVSASPSLFHFDWLPPQQVGTLPARWNHCVGYDDACGNPSLIHYTCGVPGFEETKTCEHADRWFAEFDMLRSMQPWNTIMGASRHNVDGKPRSAGSEQPALAAPVQPD
ncbi:MAG: glycosyltransferase [Burkholderiales bacterium]